MDIFETLDLPGFDGSLDKYETTATVTPRFLKRRSKQRAVSLMKKEAIREAMPECPETGYTYHLISNGQYNGWDLIPTAATVWMTRADDIYISTWTMNITSITEMLEMCDGGKVDRVTYLTSLSFKRRKTDLYGTLLNGLTERGHRFISFRNHAKVAIIGSESEDKWITIAGSANLSENARLEHYCVTNCREVYEFHRAWMDGMFDAKEKRQT